MHKKTLRQIMKDKRAAIDAVHAAQYSGAITEKLLALGCIKNAACVLAYSAVNGEPDLGRLIQACSDAGKCVALPCVGEKGEMTAVRHHPGERMVCNRYGIPEPADRVLAPKPDVVIVPGLAFDTAGCRVGFGGGYYDRYLKQTGAVRIGVCFDTQIVEQIKTDAHDVPMDIVVTQKRVIEVTGDRQCV